MSDCPSTNDLKLPELKDLVIAVRGVAEWYDLGLQLGLPDASLGWIAMHHDIKGHLRMMLSEWLQFDPEASWEKLATALNKIGKNTIAANVRREFLGVDTQVTQFTSTVEPASSQLSRAPAPASEKEGKGTTDKQAGPLDSTSVEQDTGKRKWCS